uniref:Heme oxygenase n=1 Tax=Hirondellea gigas TaxID=1518452 RepID=A0A2P2I5Q5_9CRUS
MATKRNNDVPFTKQMRIATRDVHSLSDALINAKLAIACGNDEIWAQGLLVFYEVFKQLEQSMDRNPNFLLAQLDLPGIRRTELFEKDLAYYLGKDWKMSYTPRSSVKEYTNYLQHLEETDSLRLVAYVYHLYMGLLSGGQILRKKRVLASSLTFSSKLSYEGLAVTEITGATVAEMKRELADHMNTVAGQLTEQQKEALIAESRVVFEMNNRIIRSIEGTTTVMIRKVIKFSLGLILFATLAYYSKKFFHW